MLSANAIRRPILFPQPAMEELAAGLTPRRPRCGHEASLLETGNAESGLGRESESAILLYLAIANLLRVGGG